MRQRHRQRRTPTQRRREATRHLALLVNIVQTHLTALLPHSLSPSLSVSFSVSVCLSVCLSVRPSVCLSLARTHSLARSLRSLSPSSPAASTAQRRPVSANVSVGEQEVPQQEAKHAQLDSKTKDKTEFRPDAISSRPDAISSSQLHASPASEVPHTRTQSELERLFRQRGNDGRLASAESKSGSDSANTSPALASSLHPSGDVTSAHTHTANGTTGRKTQAQLAVMYTASQSSHQPHTHAPANAFPDLW